MVAWDVQTLKMNSKAVLAPFAGHAVTCMYVAQHATSCSCLRSVHYLCSLCIACQAISGTWGAISRDMDR